MPLLSPSGWPSSRCAPVKWRLLPLLPTRALPLHPRHLVMPLVGVVQQHQHLQQQEVLGEDSLFRVGMLLLGPRPRRRLLRLRLGLLMRATAQTREENPRRQNLPQVRCLDCHISIMSRVDT